MCVCISTVSYLLFMVVCFFSRLFEKRHFLLIKKFFSFFFVIDFCLSSPFVFFSLRVYNLSLIFTPLLLSNALSKELCVLCKSG